MSKETRQLATSLFKGLDLLSLLSAERQGLGIQDLVGAMALPRTSLLRLLDSLIHYGLVARGEDRRYMVTQAFREWRKADPDQMLRDRYAPMMRRITDDLGEMTTMGRLSGREFMHIHCEEPDCRVRVTPPVGRRFAIEKMAMGKLLLGVRPDLIPEGMGEDYLEELRKIKKQRFAMNLGESEDAIVAWATWLGEPSPLTPLFAVTWPDFRFSEESLERAIYLLERESERVGPFPLFE
ncbi:helix-turn-helix domain-containing protein [Pelagicoccus sp. NFK12]|uniref:Helix-turn-helix domain-containing protein n=1 Tax=Pelagicoccus enzymogenes TaxID=2773457 RepID=A0A927IHQ1_9BACT|nr:helix-turn-helix domain-containing protein [Pelagicoccus enzymogenes]MBD5779938.1 helix-turn-helix domain-containing protein [Pelagicoccus enzymogenes]MDQ8200818.1 helix-turn-helix domain-containing protein [Pelagicoccus enzymogenes]